MIIDAAQLKWRHSQRISGIRDKKVYIGPETVTLNVNVSCNLSCRFCGPQEPADWGSQPKKSDFYQWAKFTGVVRDCVELNVDQIQFMGGEPTIHPLFREMMRHLEDKPLYVKVFTNATFPSDYCSDVIKTDHVVVNLSAADQKRYLALKGKDLFDQAISNIKRLVVLRKNMKPSFRLDIVCIVNTENIDQKQKILELAHDLGVDSVDFRKMHVSDYNRSVAFPEGSIESKEKRTPAACLSGWFNLVLMPEGSVSACGEVHRMPIGDSNQLTLKELWLSQQMMNVRLLGKYGQLQKLYEACQACPFYKENIDWMKSSYQTAVVAALVILNEISLIISAAVT